ncbi:polymorphic toxin-type HINT domain-containing protein [Winogradskya humida]|uniref:Intein n=1 Tax=Winogradskya humida TaxID=113566 RepID=A0ABQ4A3B3_9ACTN|nr:polymorphic toxin-type HINT domain-containing protein [Actinoplanes humidus]GIE25336.1 hypothetical protein Ahu01nite_084380 [Actinoplanes humidus]
MADGTVKQIGDVSLGDEVRSTDPESGDTEGKKVGVLHHHLDTDLAKVTVSNTKTGTTTVLDTTANHPFWSADRQQWVEAKDLKPGERLRSADGERSQQVASVKLWTGLKWMDDLTVNDIHTYYVLAGAVPVLVHNNGPVFDHCAPIGPVEANGRRTAWSDPAEGPAPKYNRRTQFTNMTNANRQDTLASDPICVYCGNSVSSQADHVYSVREYHQSGGWEGDKETRSADINQRGNLAGACQPCNGGGGKGGKVLGPGPGEFWPPAWPAGQWWPFGGGPRP